MPRNIFLNQARKHLIKIYGSEKGGEISATSFKRFDAICLQNSHLPKAMHMHTHVKIYPCIAVIDAQIEHGISREDALNFMFSFIKMRSENIAKCVKIFMKIPFIYKKVPKLFGEMTKEKFGKKQNFDAVFHEISNNRMQFDMTKCPYNDICTEYGYPEITKAFCRGDDIVYGNMHPKLTWGRTETIGDGDKVCNFLLTVDDTPLK